jgi:hypothetical protein
LPGVRALPRQQPRVPALREGGVMSNVIDFTQRLRERQFAAALARHLRPGWRLLMDPAFEPDCIAFLSHFPDVLFAGRDAYAALAPRVAELGGKLAVPRALPFIHVSPSFVEAPR